MPSYPIRQSHRWAIIGLLVALLVVLMMTVSASSRPIHTPTNGTAGGGAMAATPVAVNPIPPDMSVSMIGTAPAVLPTQAAAPQLPTTPPRASTPAAPKPSVAPTTKAPSAQPPPEISASGKEALDYVDFWWDTFVLAMKESDGTALTDTQLKKPDVVIVEKASCKQPDSNQLGPKSRASLTYCGGKLELVPDVFLTITDPGKLNVIASGFLHHAQANATNKQREGRTDMEVLGCLQGGLVHALLNYQAIVYAEEAWAVISPTSMGEDLHNGYLMTLEGGGVWP